MKIAVIGGGVAGLAAAHRVLKSFHRADEALDLRLFEASPRPGGIIDTVIEDDCIVELGPDSFTTLKPAALALCNEIGLAPNLISTNTSNRRAFIARNQTLNPVPEGFVMIAPTRFDTFFKSDILTRSGKLRMAIEQFIPRGAVQEDESVASFVRRRFGPEAVDWVAQPMLGGIYTADIDNLSLRATMPKYLEYEEKFGSVAAGLRDETRSKSSTAPSTNHEGGARYSVFVTLDQGMQVLVDKLVEVLGHDKLNCNARAEKIVRAAQEGWFVTFADGEQVYFDRVILAVPTAVASQLLRSVDPVLSEDFGKVKYASSVVACLLFPRRAIGHKLNGFGFVVPAREKSAILAASFASVKFAGRCPEDQVLVRVFLGGALQPGTWQLPDIELLRMAVDGLSTYLNLSEQPQRSWIKRWPNSMPQYQVGHLQLANSIEASLEKLDGLYYAGAGLRGVGVPDCIASGEKSALLALGDQYALHS